MPTADDPTSPYDQPVVSSDFLTGDVAAGLERMRMRLLDLTARNRLLNFRHTKKSSLRVVDELPDQLFTKLADGKELYFKPVPLPRGFARERAASDDQLLLASPDGPSRTVGSRPQYPPVKEYAASLGIATDYELPLGSRQDASDTPRKHADNDIQCLHFPVELESILRSIASAARLAIEETGSNMLYLAFGFLDWFETVESDQMRAAPLILLPVTLSREAADEETRAYRYAVRHSGEDILVNISLQEKLRRDFSLELPVLDDFETPESYFAKLVSLLKTDERWRVNRHVTLTLLSFGKLLLYRDLDSRTWPTRGGPADHARVTELFRGIQRERVDFAADYRLDEAPFHGKLPPIVEEADSSQHSALIDSMAGKNLVIEGPPGTGKSQTITNLIAAAMHAGKTVLFVSEKLAALEVVRHRLDRVGLGDFCLELHSHKSQKRQLLGDIEKRIKLSQQLHAPRSPEQKLQLLEEDKRRLTEYVQLVNTPFGKLERTLHETMWHARRRRGALRFPPELAEEVRIPGVEHVDDADLSNRRQRIVQYIVHLKAVLQNAITISEHPWTGFRNTEATFLDQPTIVDRLRHVMGSADELTTRIIDLNVMLGGEWLLSNLSGVERVRVAIDALPRNANDLIPRLLPLLRDPRLRQRLREFRAWVQRYRDLAKKIRDMVGAVPAVSAHSAGAIAQAVERGRQLAAGAKRVVDFTVAAQCYRDASEAISRSRTSFEQSTRLLARDIRFTSAGCFHVRRALDRMWAAPLAHLGLRHGGLEEDDAGTSLAAAERESGAIANQRAGLSKRFDLNLLPAVAVLRGHLRVMASSRWWSFVNGEFRTARREYRALTIQPGRSGRSALAADYRELLQFADGLSRFDQNARFRAVAGPHFESIDSPFAELRGIHTWLRETREAFAYAVEDGAVTCSAIWHTARERVALVRDADSDMHTLGGPLTLAVNSVALAAPWRARSANPSTDDEDFNMLGPSLEDSARELSSISETLSRAGIPVATGLNDTPELLGLLTELDSMRSLIESSRDVASALGEQFQGPETNLDRLTRSEAFGDHVSRSEVPPLLKQWILTEDAPERIRTAHTIGTELGKGLGKCRESWRQFAEAWRVAPGDWFGSAAPIEELSLLAIASRCQLAITAQDHLSSWLDYLRARGRLTADGVEALIALAERRQIAPDDLLDAFAFALANSLVQAAFARHADLARFSGLSHNAIRERFALLDRESITLHRQHAAWTISQRHAPIGVGSGPVSTWTDRSLLDNEMSKQRRHIPLRQLMRRAGRALQALKPCFMMGPLSVAQYLTPGAIKFDLVVMDEASQLRPEDALGAIARAEQVVIVGDRMQLPPTSFFDRIGDDEEETEEADAAQPVSEAESILDVASTVYKPGRLLRWHYRSRHGSLIAFSNKEFYKSELIVFPSPTAKSQDYGVKLVHVRDGVYQDRRNVIEAKRVVETAFRNMKSRPHETLGIVTLNAPQRALIEALVDERLKSDLVAQRFVEKSNAGLEPFFIKNLENVQGDERDVIYISVTYGRSAQGRVLQRFGPINGATGHRRLNVLFTRARRRVVTFASMTAADIQVQPTSAWGVRALKAYLHYAETGVLEHALLSGREPDSDFEIEVAEALRARGFEVVAQVGVAGYYIDLAVKHPKKGDAFILGIECDGSTYHSSLSARDRDRLRQSVLEDLGWQIHRIWSTDWFKNPQTEIDRVVARLTALGEMEIAQASLAEVDQLDVEPPADSSGAFVEAFPAEWLGEVAEQPLSVADAHDALLQLREEIAASGKAVEKQNALLRDEMLQQLLRSKPVTKEDWLRHTPVDLRLETDGDEVQRFLGRVLEITKRIAR